jgi:cytochrome c-type biogenesis protein CcmE
VDGGYMMRKFVVGGLIVIAAAAWAFSSFNDSLTSYVSFEKAKKIERRVQVIGAVVRNDVTFDTVNMKLTFALVNDNSETMIVEYSGSMPGNFDQAEKVVCKGRYDDGRFVADELLLKCPSKYQGDS